MWVRTMITVYEQLLSSTSSRALRALTRFVVWGPAPKGGGGPGERDDNRQHGVGRRRPGGPPVIYAAHAMLANCLRSVILCVSIPLCAAAPACNKSDEARTDRPPPPPMAASSARADLCAGGGGQDTDAISAPFVPRMAAAYCLDPHGEPKTYGDQGKLSMDDVCTTAFDGECEVYKRFGLDRVVVLRYLDGSGAPNSVEVNLSRFTTTDGSYAMFTKRVVADGDPERASVKPLEAGAAAATRRPDVRPGPAAGLSERPWRRDGPTMTARGIGRAASASAAAMVKRIGDKLPGDLALPPSAALLPTQARIALGIAYYPKDALTLSAIGPLAVGYDKDGDKRS